MSAIWPVFGLARFNMSRAWVSGTYTFRVLYWVIVISLAGATLLWMAVPAEAPWPHLA
jgi:hypothetical protein